MTIVCEIERRVVVHARVLCALCIKRVEEFNGRELNEFVCAFEINI